MKEDTVKSTFEFLYFYFNHVGHYTKFSFVRFPVALSVVWFFWKIYFDGLDEIWTQLNILLTLFDSATSKEIVSLVGSYINVWLEFGLGVFITSSIYSVYKYFDRSDRRHTGGIRSS